MADVLGGYGMMADPDGESDEDEFEPLSIIERLEDLGADTPLSERCVQRGRQCVCACMRVCERVCLSMKAVMTSAIFFSTSPPFGPRSD